MTLMGFDARDKILDGFTKLAEKKALEKEEGKEVKVDKSVVIMCEVCNENVLDKADIEWFKGTFQQFNIRYRLRCEKHNK